MPTSAQLFFFFPDNQGEIVLATSEMLVKM